MTWEEIVSLFISLGEKVHLIRGGEMDTVSLQLVPIAWFVSIKSSGVLNMGIYEGDDNRLVGTRTIPFAELSPEFLNQEVGAALAKQLVSMLDSEVVRDLLQERAFRNRRFPLE